MTLGALRRPRMGAAVALASAALLSGCQPNCSGVAFPAPEDSPYLLPYPEGEAHLLSQSVCNALGGHRNRLAYDFAMPMGAPITASRAGEVIEVVGRYRDGDLTRGHNNRILVRHEDGTIAWYGHLQHGSILVQAGDLVRRGQPIAGCGNTGNTGNLPHLHLEIFGSRPYAYDDAIPVSFRNAEGPLRKNGALAAGATYTALPAGP